MTKKDHAEWIAAYARRIGGRMLGRCQEAAAEMAAAFDDLRLVRGHVHCPEPRGKRGHWWCADCDGNIVDPTAAQFTEGIFEYEEWTEGDEVRLGTCMDCGASIWGSAPRGHVTFCSPECETRCAAYLNGGPL